MFEVTYLFVLGVAALPMALTLLRANREKRVAFVRRLYRDSAYIAIAAVGIIGLETALSISLEHFTAFGFRLSTASKSFWQYCSWPAFLLAPIWDVMSLPPDCSGKRPVDRGFCACRVGRIVSHAAVDAPHVLPRRSNGGRS